MECPFCGARFRRGIQRIGDTTFPCPSCGELLEYKLRHGTVFTLGSIAVALIYAYKAGYTGLAFASAAVIIAVLTLFILLGIQYYISPPKVQPSSKLGDTGLRLGDKGKRVGR
jgi:hypothetical protein